MGDLVERQMVIDVIWDRCNSDKHGRTAKTCEIAWAVERVPSAQPEIIRCRECKYWQNQEEGVIEVPICARPQNKFERFPMVMTIGGDGFCSFAERKIDGSDK